MAGTRLSHWKSSDWLYLFNILLETERYLFSANNTAEPFTFFVSSGSRRARPCCLAAAAPAPAAAAAQIPIFRIYQSRFSSSSSSSSSCGRLSSIRFQKGGGFSSSSSSFVGDNIEEKKTTFSSSLRSFKLINENHRNGDGSGKEEIGRSRNKKKVNYVFVVAKVCGKSWRRLAVIVGR